MQNICVQLCVFDIHTNSENYTYIKTMQLLNGKKVLYSIAYFFQHTKYYFSAFLLSDAAGSHSFLWTVVVGVFVTFFLSVSNRWMQNYRIQTDTHTHAHTQYTYSRTQKCIPKHTRTTKKQEQIESTNAYLGRTVHFPSLPVSVFYLLAMRFSSWVEIL